MISFITLEDKGYLIVVIHQDNSMFLSKAFQGLKMQQFKIQTFLNFEEFQIICFHFFVAFIDEFDLTCLSQ